MRNYYLKHILSTFFTLLFIATITFFMMRLIPGGPFTRERALPPAIEAALKAKYHLDDPLFKQYIDYMLGLFTLDLGPSFKQLGYTVNDLVSSGFPASAKVGIVATLFIVIIGIPLGILSALKQNKPIDYASMFLATLGVTIPSFVIASVYIHFIAGDEIIKGVKIPSFGIDNILGYIGPVIALSGYSISYVTRLTRSSMLDVLRQDYIRTARASGLPESKVIGKYALKNALIPVVTYVGPMIATILTGSFVVEKIFAIPGIGKYFVESVSNRDYTLVMGTTIFYAAFYIVMVLLVDFAYSFIDPRIKLGKKQSD